MMEKHNLPIPHVALNIDYTFWSESRRPRACVAMSVRRDEAVGGEYIESEPVGDIGLGYVANWAGGRRGDGKGEKWSDAIVVGDDASCRRPGKARRRAGNDIN